MAAVQISDIIVPSIFTPYTQQVTAEKARLIQSGVVTPSPVLSALLAGGGRTFDVPSTQDLDASDSTGAENVSSDDIADIQTVVDAGHPGYAWSGDRKDATPAKMATSHEVACRLNRNKSWSATELAGELAGIDPVALISNRVAYYWVRRLQRIFIATIKGILADNIANDSGDYMNDISNSGTFSDGVTNFSAEAFIDACQTLGDSADVVTVAMVHSIVYARMQKNNLIDFIPDASGQIMIPTFLNREVIVDDMVPYSGAGSNVFDTWLFGAGAVQLGETAAAVPTEVSREALAGNGGGQDVLTTRRVYSMHPTGHAFIGSPASNGGATNAELATSTSWNRVYPERKQIKFAVLRTCEFTAP